MKTKFYLVLTILLMAACITSYGQEIVSTFEHPIDAGVFMLQVTMKDGTTYHEKILKE